MIHKEGINMDNQPLDFEQIRNLLINLGFKEHEHEGSYLYRHKETDSLISLPKDVYHRHLDMIKKIVIDRGVTDNSTLEKLIKSTHISA